MADAKRPFRQRVTSSSNSTLFEKRGDPWVSQRQGLEDYGRALNTENPDLDAFTRAHRAKERKEPASDKPTRVFPDEPDDAIKAANINMRYQAAVRAAKYHVSDPVLAAKIKAMREKDGGK